MSTAEKAEVLFQYIDERLPFDPTRRQFMQDVVSSTIAVPFINLEPRPSPEVIRATVGPPFPAIPTTSDGPQNKGNLVAVIDTVYAACADTHTVYIEEYDTYLAVRNIASAADLQHATPDNPPRLGDGIYDQQQSNNYPSFAAYDKSMSLVYQAPAGVMFTLLDTDAKFKGPPSPIRPVFSRDQAIQGPPHHTVTPNDTSLVATPETYLAREDAGWVLRRLVTAQEIDNNTGRRITSDSVSIPGIPLSDLEDISPAMRKAILAGEKPRLRLDSSTGTLLLEIGSSDPLKLEWGQHPLAVNLKDRLFVFYAFGGVRAVEYSSNNDPRHVSPGYGDVSPFDVAPNPGNPQDHLLVVWRTRNSVEGQLLSPDLEFVGGKITIAQSMFLDRLSMPRVTAGKPGQPNQPGTFYVAFSKGSFGDYITYIHQVDTTGNVTPLDVRLFFRSSPNLKYLPATPGQPPRLVVISRPPDQVITDEKGNQRVIYGKYQGNIISIDD